MNLILLCAGRGSRLSTKNRLKPKSLIQINNRPIIEYNKNFFNNFKKKIMITGYKKNLLEKFSKKYNFNIIHNNKFNKTNMVYSLFLAKGIIDDDVVVCYGDIIFDKEIINLLKENKDLLPVNKLWFDYWKKRMSKNKILEDAENLTYKNNYLLSIGGKIKKKYPSTQYMGIFKLKKKTFYRLHNLFLKIQNKNIDMTSFLNLSIKFLKLRFKIKLYHSYWFEIDNDKDILVAKKDLKNIFF